MQSTSNIYFPIFICSFFFDDAGLYALQISICSNKSRGEPESNPGVPGQQRISPPLGLSNRAHQVFFLNTLTKVGYF